MPSKNIATPAKTFHISIEVITNPNLSNNGAIKCDSKQSEQDYFFEKIISG